MQGRLSRRFLEKGTVECRDTLVRKLLQVHEWAEDVQPGMGRAEEAGVGRAEGRHWQEKGWSLLRWCVREMAQPFMQWKKSIGSDCVFSHP